MNRRKALITSGLGALLPFTGELKAGDFAYHQSENLKIGMAGYSFAHYKGNIDQVISVMQATGVNHMTLKDFQLPYSSNQEQAAAIITKLRTAGIEPYGLGVIYMESVQDVEKFFAYAATAGISLIIGSPAPELLPAVEEKVKTTGIRFAIHNHGPEDKRYPDIDSIYALIKNKNSGMGICLDVGHSFRCGHDPADMLKRYGSRVMDMHIKDVTEPIPSGTSTIPGRGKLNLRGVFEAAVSMGYQGFCSLEYERPGDPALGIAESIGYMKGLMKGLSR